MTLSLCDRRQNDWIWQREGWMEVGQRRGRGGRGGREEGGGRGGEGREDETGDRKQEKAYQGREGEEERMRQGTGNKKKHTKGGREKGRQRSAHLLGL